MSSEVFACQSATMSNCPGTVDASMKPGMLLSCLMTLSVVLCSQVNIETPRAIWLSSLLVGCIPSKPVWVSVGRTWLMSWLCLTVGWLVGGVLCFSVCLWLFVVGTAESAG